MSRRGRYARRVIRRRGCALLPLLGLAAIAGTALALVAA